MNKKRRRAIVRFFNAYGLKEYLMLLKHYKISFRGPAGPGSPAGSGSQVGSGSPAGPGRAGRKPMLISVVDKRRKTKGLTDRFKGIVSMYALSKANGVPFRVIFNHPVELTDFLVPNTYNWVPQEGELSDFAWDVRFKIMTKQPPLSKLTRMFPLRKQVLVYAKVDYLEEINKKYNTDYRWGELFNELFKPSELLERSLRSHIDRIGGGGGYIACVFRFQALLGDFKEYHFKPLPEEQQGELIEKNKEAVRNIAAQSDVPVLVTSDSVTFLSVVESLPNVCTIPGRVVHIDNADNEPREVYMKSFVDFLMLSGARHIYSIGTSEMYKTDFPKYAARIKDVPFERILLE